MGESLQKACEEHAANNSIGIILSAGDQFLGADIDSGTILGFIFGYFAISAGVFLLYLPFFVLLVALLVVAGILQLLLLPFVILIRKLRRSGQEPDMDASSLQRLKLLHS